MMKRQETSRARKWQFSLSKLMLVVSFIAATLALLPMAIQGGRIAFIGLLALYCPITCLLYVEFIRRFVVQSDDTYDASIL